jgi:flagellar hook protein FlgE
MNANLDANQTVSAVALAGTYDATVSANNMASGNVTPDFSTPFEIYNSQGGRHTVNLSFLKTANPNEWQVEMHVTPASEIEGATDGILGSGTVTFTASGLIDAANSTFDPAGTIAIGASSATAGVRWATGLGIDAQNITMNLGDGVAATGLTQYASDSIMDTASVDGVPFGSLSNVEIDDDGFMIAQYTNGLNRKIYQIPVATFDNPGGLVAQPGSSFRASSEVGTMTLRAPRQGEAGALAAYTLETSTVDLAEEFSNLITTQRAYSASSKIITTADEMLDELVRIKR